MNESNDIWSIVLAGGEGRRLSSFIKEAFGEERPKQYCAFTGARTMLEHTLDRAQLISDHRRIVTVIDQGHWPWLDEPRRQFVPGRIVGQPANRETGPGVYLPLAYAAAEDPDATVVLLPSDHFIRPNAAFAADVRRAASLTAAFPDRLCLLAARPDRPEPDYGWIEPGDWLVGSGLQASTVRRFAEKPSIKEAARMHNAGWLWNTMITVGTVRAFRDLAEATRPELADRFSTLVDAIRLGRESSVLRAVYAGMPSVNFSADMLQRAPQRLLTMPMGNHYWCDWGRPERIQSTLKWLKMKPAFRAGAEVPA